VECRDLLVNIGALVVPGLEEEDFAAGSGEVGGEGPAARARTHDDVLIPGQDRCRVISRYGLRGWIIGHYDSGALHGVSKAKLLVARKCASYNRAHISSIWDFN
jgi:hypothetical protein